MIKIGDDLWTKDSRDHRAIWRCLSVIGETKQSWLLKPEYDWGRVTKINKKTMLENCGRWGNERWFTKDGMEAYRFIMANRQAASSKVMGLTDAEKLRRVMVILEEES